MSFWDTICRIARRVNAVQVFGVGVGLEPPPDRGHDLARSVPETLLRFVLDYPLRGDAEASWAVKESSVLRGELGTARERPGLGVSIVVVDLALRAFGDNSDDRIERCIAWALGRREKTDPFYILGEQLDPETSAIKLKPDFRHTIAFAVILEMTGRYRSYSVDYVKRVLHMQQPDGGWAPGSGVTVSQVSTVLYAAELLHRVSSAEGHPEELRRRSRHARDRALDWLANTRGEDGLWESGVMKEYRWDGLVSTAWVLHRLSDVGDVGSPWHSVAEGSLTAMLEGAMDPTTWVGTASIQRARVEARIAAAAARASRRTSLGDVPGELARTYVSAWRPKAERWAASLAETEMDLSTTVFLLEGMLDPGKLRSVGCGVVGAQRVPSASGENTSGCSSANNLSRPS